MQHSTGRSGPPPRSGRIRDACARWGVSRSWLYRAAKAGQIRMFKAGRTTMVDYESVERHVASLPSVYVLTV